MMQVPPLAPRQAKGQADMPNFMKRMQRANQNIICTASAAGVRKVKAGELLQHRLRIPLFQRRYAWSGAQWQTLLDDATNVAEGRKASHQLGRITCVQNDDGSLIVVDGQQRNTSTCLLLAAVRDAALTHPQRSAIERERCAALSTRINEALFPDSAALDKWLQEHSSVSEGIALDFAAVLPTYCDRQSFFAATLPGMKRSDTSAWSRPAEAKAFFMEGLAGRSIEMLEALAEAILCQLEWLLFPLQLGGGHDDGTEDIAVVFERLAIRDATVCRPHRQTEFANMGAADFVRNLVLGSFRNEADAVEMYKRHWLPIEKAAAVSATCADRGIAAILEEMLRSFLDAKAQRRKSAKMGAIGGQLYADFRAWFTAAVKAAVDAAKAKDSGSEDAEYSATASLLRDLEEFALVFFSGSAKPKVMNSTATAFAARKAVLADFAESIDE